MYAGLLLDVNYILWTKFFTISQTIIGCKSLILTLTTYPYVNFLKFYIVIIKSLASDLMSHLSGFWRYSWEIWKSGSISSSPEKLLKKMYSNSAFVNRKRKTCTIILNLLIILLKKVKYIKYMCQTTMINVGTCPRKLRISNTWKVNLCHSWLHFSWSIQNPLAKWQNRCYTQYAAVSILLVK